MPVVVERSFEPAGDVVTFAEARCRHRLGRGQAPASRTTNEEEVVVQLDAKRLKLAGETLREARVYSLIGKSLPLDEDSTLADRPKIRKPHIGPLRPGTHIDKLRARA